MSFTYGGFSSDEVGGVTATLSEWPSLGGMSVEAQAIPGRDGRHYSGVAREATRLEFDVIITGSTVEETMNRRAQFVGLIDPARGPRSMTVEGEDDWAWNDVLIAEEIQWDRMTWDHGLGFVLRSEGVVFETVGTEPAARQIDPDVITFTGSETFTFDEGNTEATPRMEIAPISDADELEISIGDFSVTVERFNSWTGQHRLVMDWEEMRFYLENEDGDRLASAVGHMSGYDAPRLLPGDEITIEVEPSRPVEFYPNARRIG